MQLIIVTNPTNKDENTESAKLVLNKKKLFRTHDCYTRMMVQKSGQTI